LPKIQYQRKNFRPDALAAIVRANQVLDSYAAQGYRLTLRQLYYQFVSRGWIANKDSEYKRLGGIVADARMAGMIDWNQIEDRGRWLRSVPHWTEPSDIIDSAARSYRIDKWTTQPYRLEVWIEKDALVGVIETVCTTNDIGYFACRGYASATAIWEAAMHRFVPYLKAGQYIRILHLGDHDPSGLDMSRDIEERTLLFCASHLGSGTFGRVKLERLALNMDQIEQYAPPPNPAKLTDTRARAYIAEHGSSSWELDALEPQVINALISDAIINYRDETTWQEAVEQEQEERRSLREIARHYTEIADQFGGEDV
jgi:hypothetical protein